MNWTGLLRSLQPTLIATGAALVIATVALILVRGFIKRAAEGDDASAKKLRGWATWGYGAVWLIALAALAVHALTVMSTDRTPRSGFDRSGINDRVEQLQDEARQTEGEEPADEK